jgi:hypothetical protein
VVEHFLGKEGVTGSIPVVGFLEQEINRRDRREYLLNSAFLVFSAVKKNGAVSKCVKSFNCNAAIANVAITALQKTRKIHPTNWNARSIVPGAIIIHCTRK